MRNSLLDIRLQEIEKIASEARGEAALCLADLGLTLSASTDLRYVATVLTNGIVDPRANLSQQGERLAGLLRWEGVAPAIFFEAYDPLVRQRFSIAHELGHFYLHAESGKSMHYRCSQTQVDVDQISFEKQKHDPELEADAFAGAFLVPFNNLTDDLRQFGCCIAFLAERYLVSKATMRRRIKTLEWLKK